MARSTGAVVGSNTAIEVMRHENITNSIYLKIITCNTEKGIIEIIYLNIEKNSCENQVLRIYGLVQKNKKR